MNTSDEVLQSLITLCKESEIIPEDASVNEDDDLFEYGVIDSMGLIILTCIIEENNGLKISPELLIAELRSPRAIADYIMQNSLVNASAV